MLPVYWNTQAETTVVAIFTLAIGADMHVQVIMRYRNDRVKKYLSTYLTAIDVADYGYHGAAVRATGLFPDEIIEIKSTQGESLYTEVTWYRVCRFEDIEIANATTEETTITQGVE